VDTDYQPADSLVHTKSIKFFNANEGQMKVHQLRDSRLTLRQLDTADAAQTADRERIAETEAMLASCKTFLNRPWRRIGAIARAGLHKGTTLLHNIRGDPHKAQAVQK
jgi:hypothetical protein